MIEIFVEPSGLDADRSHVARAYLGEELVAGVVFAYGADQDEARDRLIEKMQTWAAEKVSCKKAPVCRKCGDTGAIERESVSGNRTVILDCACRESPFREINDEGKENHA